MEQMVFDPDSGQMLAGSLMDYAMPRGDDLCPFEVESNPVPTPANPLGVKGAGEAGTVGALPAVISAVSDAMRPLGIGDIEMPATSGTAVEGDPVGDLLESVRSCSNRHRCPVRHGRRRPTIHEFFLLDWEQAERSEKQNVDGRPPPTMTG